VEIIDQIKQAIRNKRLPVHDEKLLQGKIEQELIKCGLNVKREYAFDKKDIVDFFIDGVAVEVKIKGSSMAIHRQLKRYATYVEVKQIVLITAKHMGLPTDINGKPATLIHISTAWL